MPSSSATSPSGASSARRGSWSAAPFCWSAAFFSSILPNPKERHLQYCAGQLSRTGDGKVQRILKVMRERDRLTEDEYQVALVTPLIFDRTDASSPEECTAMTRRIMRNARPTTPPRRRLGPDKIE